MIFRPLYIVFPTTRYSGYFFGIYQYRVKVYKTKLKYMCNIAIFQQKLLNILCRERKNLKNNTIYCVLVLTSDNISVIINYAPPRGSGPFGRNPKN